MNRFFVVLCAIGIVGCEKKETVRTMSNMNIQIWLGQPVSKINGLVWPTQDQKLIDSNTIEEEARITLHFPSGRNYSSSSKATFLSQEGGIVSRVVITPLTNALPFRETVDGLKSILGRLNVGQHERTVAIIRNFETHQPDWNNLQSQPLSCEIEKDIELFAEIKPAREERKWFISCGFYVSHYFK